MLRPVVIAAVVMSALAAGVSPAEACSVPVFRYALERWMSDAYRVVVFHRGPMTKTQQQLAADLGPQGLAGEKYANVVVRTVDLDAKPDAGMQALWQSQKNASLPWMVVRYPDTVPYAPAWSGPLTESAVDTLLDSPMRRELAKRLLQGESSIWLFVDSGDAKQDDAAFHRLKTQLAIEQTQLKLPEIDEADLVGGDAKTEIAKLQIRFSILRISRDDPKEKLLIAMLQGSEGSGPDSLRDPEYFNQPMAFPIFGRGRIRYGLVGAGIAEDTIHSACAYLVGPCKCQIKEGVENRGMDLVMAVDWNRMVVSTVRDKPAPPLLGLGTFKDLTPWEPVSAVKPQPSERISATATSNVPTTVKTNAAAGQTVTAKPVSEVTPQPEGGSDLPRNMFLMFALAGFVIAVASLVVFAKKS